MHETSQSSANIHRPKIELEQSINLAAQLIREQTGGVTAELRRLEPDRPESPAFWRLLARIVDDQTKANLSEEVKLDYERRWAIILRALAQLGSLHVPRNSLGRVLSENGFSEYRFLRLLRARGPMMEREIRMVVHWCVSQGLSVDTADIGDLVMSEGTRREESVRRRLAREFFWKKEGEGRG